MKKRLLFGMSALWALPSTLAFGELRISEFMAENLNTVSNDLSHLDDEELDSSDWVEIQNTGDSEISLAGHYLTDDADQLDKWQFPSDLSVPAGKQIVVFVSGKDQHQKLTIFERSNPIKPTHTNFRLGSKGEYLGLVAPDGETVIHDYGEKYPRQIGTVSYGIDENGELGYFSEATPGAANGTRGAIGPYIKDVENLSGQPAIGVDDSMTITAEVEAHEAPVGKVTLVHRFMFKSEIRTEMRDDGVAPDETADDGVYSASFNLQSVFGSQIDPGEMVRWRVEAEDDQGTVMRDPLFHDPNNADEYYGTVAVDPSLETSNLDVFHWFIENPTRANNDSGTKASVMFLGEFYDNIHVDIHGQSTRGFPKKSWDFDFNSPRRFKYDEEEDRVRDINMLTNWADKSKVRNTMAYEMYAMGGVAGHWAFPVRIQQNGEFLGTWDMVEDGDSISSERNGLDGDGALYKMYNRLDNASGAEKKTRKWEDKDDVEELIDGISGGGDARIDYIYDNVDIPSMVNYLVMNSVINNTDYGHKNYYVYRDTEGTGEWTELPWDVDLSLGRRWIGSHNYFFDPIQTTHSPVEGSGHTHGNRLAELFMGNSILNEMIYRRLRTMYDHFYGPPGGSPKSDYMLRRLEELENLIDPEGVVSDADLDYEAGLADMNRKFNENNGWDNKDTLREGTARIRDEYIPGRRDYVYGLSKLPNEQKPFSEFKLSVESVDFLPASGNQQEEYLVIKNTTGEWVDLSHFRITGAIEHTIRPGTVVPTGNIFSPDQGNIYFVRDAKAFRARSESPKGGERLLVQGNYKGQLSSRGETLQILDPEGNVVAEHTYEGNPSAAQESLRITEVMYRPESGAEGSGYASKDFEYLELTNTGSEPLDLSGVAFIDGIAYAFEDGTTLAAGEVALLVSNREAFESRYGTDLNVLGEFNGNLSNSGERIVLRDAREENILSFDYDQDWFTEADQEGHSLEVADPNQNYAQWDLGEGWAASSAPGGTPGSLDGGGGPVDPQPGAMTYATWRQDVFTPNEDADEALSGPMGDVNGDGSVNLLAYAFLYGPHGEPVLPEITVGPSELSVSFLQRKDADDLIYRVEISEDLVNWTTAGEEDPNPTPVDPSGQRVTIKAAPMEGTKANYVRVAVELKP